MSSGLVRAAIQSVVDKTPTLSQRSSKLKEKAQEVLAKACIGKACIGERELEAMDKFSADILTYLRGKVKSVADKYKGTNKKREHLWSAFHEIRMTTNLSSLWKDLLEKLDVSIDGPLLEQSVYQECFEIILRKFLKIVPVSVGLFPNLLLTAFHLMS